MLFDPFLYHGMDEMRDRHREMRLDVDNMSYEVNRGYVVLLSINNFSLVSSDINLDCRNYWNGGGYRRRKHWTERRYNS